LEGFIVFLSSFKDIGRPCRAQLHTFVHEKFFFDMTAKYFDMREAKGAKACGEMLLGILSTTDGESTCLPDENMLRTPSTTLSLSDLSDNGLFTIEEIDSYDSSHTFPTGWSTRTVLQSGCISTICLMRLQDTKPLRIATLRSATTRTSKPSSQPLEPSTTSPHSNSSRAADQPNLGPGQAFIQCNPGSKALRAEYLIFQNKIPVKTAL
jgi:hypothetical protein